MSMDNIEKIKDRIAKLLRMAQDASSPNEAAIAAGRARKLMDEYQIDAFDVSQRVQEEFGVFGATKYFKKMPTYMSILSVAVAKYNDCQARYDYGRIDFGVDIGAEGERVLFQGYKSDSELAGQMFERLIGAVNRLCKEYLTAQGFATYQVALGLQFKEGAVQAILQRLATMTAERDQITVGAAGNSLVVVKKQGVDAHFGEVKYGSSKARVGRSKGEMDARTNGYVKGSTVEITPMVNG
jgi:hypothetical protein